MSVESAASPLRYKRLAYVALNVSDLARSTAFYRDLVGLSVSESCEAFVALRCSRDHHNLLLYRGRQPGIKRVGFELDSVAELATARRELEALGLSVEALSKEELKALRTVDALRFRLPGCGLCIELLVQMMHMAEPYRPTVSKIERLGHVVLNVRDFQAAMDWLCGKLGFRVSDLVPEFAAFLRCHPNPLHHSFAILAGAEDHLNHINFMVTDIDDIGCAMNRIKKAGVEVVFGPGRHQPSESIFLYFQDPDGMTVEYSFGMEKFPEFGAREARLLEPVPATLDSWGSVPAPGFGKTGRIETPA
ncbi:2,3-dihydroxy-p-cumate/2,3-dihydroxybenzoate 3,4-dioxygenase [Solimonas aquatica]|uniref:2,3-dihydroxy-p-cumate/2,3-dihydroxybenzoate 3,4-dioxygenase n=1 Tax=Solimonas aquatica TaxID=489703 RepID=A0A1H9BG38_9GAMM|nr:VOC family protein [Solimonas aquatica]SEP87701.1 2,3-dihydroxy-p-cumate/2,3-dihydroxybenzoate 3,4-dioxygenase [Solimonas aquatica]